MVDMKTTDMMVGPNEVIDPENIEPLRESEESPLSLLAKTCSNIGLDLPPRSQITTKSSTTSPHSPTVSSPGYSIGGRSPRRKFPGGSRSPRRDEKKSEVTFKPYETTMKSSESGSSPGSSPRTMTSSPHIVTSNTSMTSSVSPSVSPTASPPKLSTTALPSYGLGSPLDALFLRSMPPPAACHDPLFKGCLPGLCSTIYPHGKTLPTGGFILGTGLYPPTGLAGGILPYCCNWSQAGVYCGRRFTCIDELLSHFRSHTQNDATGASSIPSSAPMLSSLPSALHPLLTVGGADGQLSRSHFPASQSAGVGTARYHPYGKVGTPPVLPVPGPLALYPYLASPYLYSQRR